MTELLVIAAIVLPILFFVVMRPRVSVQSPVPPPRPEIIEDSSLLKAELAATQEKVAKLNQELGRLSSLYVSTEDTLREKNKHIMELTDKFEKLQSQKKSGEVRLGHVAEQLIPMLPEFPVPINTLKFFGQPLDYISIDLDSEWISFIEVKSGGSVLSDKQRKIRKMIEDRKVRFFEVRIDDKGIKVK